MRHRNDGEISAARRGQIIQRVLVDGWSPARAAKDFAVSERQVARWVAGYRRRGMASLRPIGSEPLAWRLWSWLVHAMGGLSGGLGAPTGRAAAPVRLELRRGGNERRQQP